VIPRTIRPRDRRFQRAAGFLRHQSEMIIDSAKNAAAATKTTKMTSSNLVRGNIAGECAGPSGGFRSRTPDERHVDAGAERGGDIGERDCDHTGGPKLV
jgi:hypothetical protein